MKIDLLNPAVHDSYIEKIKEITLRNPSKKFNTKSIAKEIVNTREIDDFEQNTLSEMKTYSKKSNYKKNLEQGVALVIESKQFIKRIKQQEKQIAILYRSKDIFFSHS